jgi:hypothetical protein
LSRSRYPERARRVIVLISDGEDNLSHVNHTKAEEAALEEGISIFSVVAGPSVAESRGVKFLKEASQKTGGLSTDKDIKRAVHLLLAAIDAQSEVILDSAQAGDGRLHPIKIKSSQKDIHIYAPDAVLLE